MPDLSGTIIYYHLISGKNHRASVKGAVMGEQKKWMTMEELVESLMMSKTKLYEMMRDGRMPGFKVGRHWRFDRDEVDAWIKGKWKKGGDEGRGVRDEGKGVEGYVHGYSPRERERLVDQATTLEELLHCDTTYPAGSRVLEAGCGVGAQTVALAKRSPQASFIAVDIAEDSLAEARRRVAETGASNVVFMKGDVYNLPFTDESFDHVFVCFLLEHLAEPERAVGCLARVLKKGGTLTVIEGDHGSTYFHPDSKEAHIAIDVLVHLQKRGGGDALIGRRLYPLLRGAVSTSNVQGSTKEQKDGRQLFGDVRVSPRMVYVDSSRPQLVEGFTKKTFTAMVEGVRQEALDAGMIDAATLDKGIADLYRTAEADGVFCYTFFKAVAVKR